MPSSQESLNLMRCGRRLADFAVFSEPKHSAWHMGREWPLVIYLVHLNLSWWRYLEEILETLGIRVKVKEDVSLKPYASLTLSSILSILKLTSLSAFRFLTIMETYETMSRKKEFLNLFSDLLVKNDMASRKLNEC